MIVASHFHTFPYISILSSPGFRHQSIESLASLRHDTIFKFGPQPSLGSRWMRRSHPYDSAPEPGWTESADGSCKTLGALLGSQTHTESWEYCQTLHGLQCHRTFHVNWVLSDIICHTCTYLQTEILPKLLRTLTALMPNHCALVSLPWHEIISTESEDSKRNWQLSRLFMLIQGNVGLCQQIPGWSWVGTSKQVNEARCFEDFMSRESKPTNVWSKQSNLTARGYAVLWQLSWCLIGSK